MELQENLIYPAKPERIVDVKDRQLRNKIIRLVKVFRKGMTFNDATWETEDKMRQLYSQLFL